MTIRKQHYPDSAGLMHILTHRNGSSIRRTYRNSCQMKSQLKKVKWTHLTKILLAIDTY